MTLLRPQKLTFLSSCLSQHPVPSHLCADSKWNPQISIVDNIKLPPTLLSRFDLIYLILDKPDRNKDRRLARHMVGLYAKDAAADMPTDRIVRFFVGLSVIAATTRLISLACFCCFFFISNVVCFKFFFNSVSFCDLSIRSVCPLVLD